ncbi:hypothetical protein TNCV_976121 [Trichonephila clavipes]|nr:hypothetical protein TNCV_976121 [Trichonephila clavipes]
MQGNSLPDRQTCRVCRRYVEDSESRWNAVVAGAVVALLKQKTFLEGCTTIGIRNYDQKSSGRPNSGTTWNSLRSRRFLECHVSSRQLHFN